MLASLHDDAVRATHALAAIAEFGGESEVEEFFDELAKRLEPGLADNAEKAAVRLNLSSMSAGQRMFVSSIRDLRLFSAVDKQHCQLHRGFSYHASMMEWRKSWVVLFCQPLNLWTDMLRSRALSHTGRHCCVVCCSDTAISSD